MRYATVTPTAGRDLHVGMWLDSLNHGGARMIYAVEMPTYKPGAVTGPDSDFRTVTFSLGDTELVRCDVIYDVVDPDSLIPESDPDDHRYVPGMYDAAA